MTLNSSIFKILKKINIMLRVILPFLMIKEFIILVQLINTLIVLELMGSLNHGPDSIF